MNKLKKISVFFGVISLVLFTGCKTVKEYSQVVVDRVPAKFDFAPPTKAGIASADMTIAILKPSFVKGNAEYLVEPFPTMAKNMGNDFEELLSSKGFTMRGPFVSRDEMVYNEKVNSSFILEISIDLMPNYSATLLSHRHKLRGSILLGIPPSTYFGYTTKGNITFTGNLVLTALSPQYGEKIWKKNIALDKITFPYEGSKEWDSKPEMNQELSQDPLVYNTVSTELDKLYNSILTLVWRQIDPAEMKTVTIQAKKADSRGN